MFQRLRTSHFTMYKFGDGDTQNDPAYQYLMQCMVAACIYKAVHDGNDIISISASGGSVDAKYLRDAIEYADTIINLAKENANPQIVGFEGFSPECGHGMIDAERTIKNAIKLNNKRQGLNK